MKFLITMLPIIELDNFVLFILGNSFVYIREIMGNIFSNYIWTRSHTKPNLV